ncbi:MAG: hypothetical protein XD52_0516 [bacterium 42_11]|nr:MAG: hypothetical protein XD52_0516 [bacterium 42_11]
MRRKKVWFWILCLGLLGGSIIYAQDFVTKSLLDGKLSIELPSSWNVEEDMEDETVFITAPGVERVSILIFVLEPNVSLDEEKQNAIEMFKESMNVTQFQILNQEKSLLKGGIEAIKEVYSFATREGIKGVSTLYYGKTLGNAFIINTVIEERFYPTYKDIVEKIISSVAFSSKVVAPPAQVMPGQGQQQQQQGQGGMMMPPAQVVPGQGQQQQQQGQGGMMMPPAQVMPGQGQQQQQQGQGGMVVPPAQVMPMPQPTPMPGPLPMPVLPPGWSSYKDPKGYFSIGVPPSWYLNPIPNQDIPEGTPYVNYVYIENGVVTADFTVVIENIPVGFPLKDYAAAVESNVLSSLPGYKKYLETTLDIRGRQFIKRVFTANVVGSTGEEIPIYVEQYYCVSNGLAYILNLEANLNGYQRFLGVFSSIAQSFQPLK